MPVIIEAVTTRSDFAEFIKLPYRLHKHHPAWVPPLISETKDVLNKKKHPFYKHAESQLFIAHKDGKTVGRIAGVIDQNYIKTCGTQVGQYGFFDCVDDMETAGMLFDQAGKWLKSKGMEKMLGPTNPSMNDELGVLMDAFDIPPAVKMIWNPDYYPKLYETAGFKKAMDLCAWEITADQVSKRMLKLGEAILKRGRVKLRHPNMKNFDAEIQIFRSIYNRAWTENWGFVPWTEEEFEHLAKSLKQVIDPDLALIAEVNGEAVGFSLILPDLNVALKRINGRLFPLGLIKLLWHSRKINQARAVIMGVLKEYRSLGIDTAFYYQTYQIATRKGYNRGELSWVLENNKAMNRVLKIIGARKYKTYRLFERPL